MIRPGRFFRQISRHIRREKRLSLGSFLVLFIVLMLIDAFWVASININNEYQDILKMVKMEVYLTDDLPDSSLVTIKTNLEMFEDVAAVEYVSKDDAARILETDLGPGVLEGLDFNPLPRSFVLRFSRGKNLGALDEMAGQLERLYGVDTVDFGRAWIQKVESVGTSLRRVGYIAGGLILFVVLLTMANTNRLTARSKSREFMQLKLLGAGPAYLIYPYLAEGFFSAFIAAWLGWLVFFYAADRVTFTDFTLVLPMISDMAQYCVAAGVTGMAGAYLGIRRYLIA